MQIILQKANFNEIKLKTYISRITVEELNKLSQPCYYPIWQNYLHELLNLSNLTEDDIKKFKKRFFSESKIQVNLAQYGKSSKLLQDTGSNFLIILLYYFLSKKDIKTYSTIMLFYMIRQYGNYLRENLDYCSKEVFSYTLDNMNPSHLFSREKSISNAIFYLSNEMKRRFTNGFSNLDINKISDFVFESRSRIAQSLRSFLESYYKYQSEGMGINTPKETEEGKEIESKAVEKGTRIAEMISKKICIFKEVDLKALQEARIITKISIPLSILLINNLQNVSFHDDIKFIIELFLKDMKSIKDLCGKNFYTYVKNLMGIKRTIKKVFFKKEINKLIIKLIDESKYEKKYNKLTKQTQFQINSFLSFYLTLYTKNVIC